MLLVVASVGLAAACAAVGVAVLSDASPTRPTTKSIDNGGVPFPETTPLSPTEARVSASAIVNTWRDEIVANAAADPGGQFESPDRATLVARLQNASNQVGFQIVNVEMLQPAQSAPLVVVRTADPVGFVGSALSIVKALDPKRDTGDDRTGWAYEGFLLEAVNANGVPFFIFRHTARGPHVGGGVWISDPALRDSMTGISVGGVPQAG
jgi:hypothetical protein